jgi:hypothetical protein
VFGSWWRCWWHRDSWRGRRDPSDIAARREEERGGGGRRKDERGIGGEEESLFVLSLTLMVMSISLGVTLKDFTAAR